MTKPMMAPLTPPRKIDPQGARGRALVWRIWRDEIRHYKWRVTAVIILTLLTAGLTALYPLVIKRAVDMFTARDPRILYQVPALVVVLTGLKALCQYGQSLSVQTLVLLVIRNLQFRMFGHALSADIARIEREAPAQWASRFTTDAVSIRDAMVRAVNALGDVVTVIGLALSMILYGLGAQPHRSAAIPAAAVPIQKLGRRVRRASGSMQEQIGKTASILNESFALARQVRVYGLEPVETRRIDHSLELLHIAFMKITRGRARVDPVLEVLGGTAIALVLGFAGWRSTMGGSDFGGFTAFIAALFAASRPLRALGSLNAALQEGLGGVERVFTVIDEPPAVTQSPNARNLPEGRGDLIFSHVQFSYPMGAWVCAT